MITYNDIYEAARKERYSDQLQPLAKRFVLDVSNYLKDKKQLALKEDDSFSDMIAKTKKQLENANTLFKELIDGNGEKIGPFEKDQMANLPKEISKILVEDGKAEFVEE